MLRTVLALALLAIGPLAHAADAIIHLDAPGQTLYVRVFTGATTAVAEAMTEGTGSGAGRYVVADSALVTAGLSSAGTYTYKVFSGSESTSADDPLVGVGVLYWSGSVVLPRASQASVDAIESSVDALPTAAEVWTAAERTITGGTITTNSDKAGYALATAPPTATEVRDAIFGHTVVDTGAGTFGRAMEWLNSAFASDGVLSEAALANAPAVEGGGTSQPRINRKPDPAFTLQVSRRADGTHKAPMPIRITPGDIDQVYVFIDMAPLFGPDNYVETVGTPTVEAGGSITASAEGPRDTYAVVELGGTATASEERTVTVPVTMETGTTVDVMFDVIVFAE